MLSFLILLLLGISALNYVTSRRDSNFRSSAVISSESDASFESCLISQIESSNSTLLSTKIVLPTSPTYAVSTLTFNLAIQHNSSAIVYASDSKDVSDAIRCAAQFKIPVVPRSGGHSYASFSSYPQGLIIDVSNLKEFSFGTNHSGAVDELVTFGAGLRLGDLEMALQEHERAIPHGSCLYLGVSGHATCGGFGESSRQWGLFSDHIVELEVVSANGTIFTASEDTNPDLFFAMRGAGASFGIVTSLTLRTHQAPTNVILFEIIYQFDDAEVAATNLHHFQSWGLKSAPSQLGIRWSVNINHPESSDENKDLTWKLRGIFMGHIGRFNRTINRLTSGFTVKGEIKTLERLDWLESVRALDDYKTLSSEGINPSTYNASFYAKSFIVRDFSPMSYDQWKKMTKAVYSIVPNLKPSERLYWFLEIALAGGRYQGQATGVRGSKSTTSSFGPRDALLLFQMGGYGPKGASLYRGHLMDPIKTTSNLVYESLDGGKKELTGFNCYVDSDFSADRAHREYFGGKNTKRLKDLKKVWDPNGVFRHPHSF